MNQDKFYIGQTPFIENEKKVTGSTVQLGDEPFACIENFDGMVPFFMSIVSDSDHWMFISSNGGLTAGRKNPDHALFPYYTDDRIHDSHDTTGSRSILLVEHAGILKRWEPLSKMGDGIYQIQRNLYKHQVGSQILFEEINHDLGLVFRYSWANSEQFGWVRTASVENIGKDPCHITILDGIQNILPAGITRRFQLEYSTLADGYKKNELLEDSKICIYSLSSVPTDRAEPSESLYATTVWSCGLDNAKILLSSKQIEAFRKGHTVSQETDIRAARGAYFLKTSFNLESKNKKEWLLVIDLDQTMDDIAGLRRLIKNEADPAALVNADIKKGTDNLIRIVARADGLQKTGDALNVSRHFANVLFNAMRGGILDNGYSLDKKDFIQFLQTTNRPLLKEVNSFIDKLPVTFNIRQLLSQARELKNAPFEKLCYEYLPLTFGRRHGDPSRPWNIFNIDIKDESGEKKLNYEGNWRDIFQNWEALAWSFPGIIEGMIAKFVNATTVDGHNPYHISRDGFDWEVLDPTDTWSYIGYWGDHQIIYLLKLLELSKKVHPNQLRSLLTRDIYAYANVPYRIRSYEKLLADPRNTIDFDTELHEQVLTKVAEIGTDGKFVMDKNGDLYQVNLVEKLLVSILAKVSNFIPEAGIWMNTQRPEWNDANNALVGSGVSMVTLYYMRRYLAFCEALFKDAGIKQVEISKEVTIWFQTILDMLKKNANLFKKPMSDIDRKKILDGLGQAASAYRLKLYRSGFSGEKSTLQQQQLIQFCESALSALDHSIQINKRPDHLYHAYNLVKITPQGIAVRHLYEMLEGQVAALSSGQLGPTEAVEVLDALRNSSLYRECQNSYILYPDRQLPLFVEKNRLPESLFNQSELLKTLVHSGNQKIVTRDLDGDIHFHASFRNAARLNSALDQLTGDEIPLLVEKERNLVLSLYEQTFDHQSFTGRSGTFYKYEGLGSIYWHMVSKLLLAVGELCEQAVTQGESESVIQRLKDHYFAIREGIGVHKSPEDYGAFTTDPYSHTPSFAGVQQPGMTGQVKEDILTRWMELSLVIQSGAIRFNPLLIQESEFLKTEAVFNYIDVDGCEQSIVLSAGMLAFTFCQVPIILHRADESRIIITKKKDHILVANLELDQTNSQSILDRNGDIHRLDVYIKR